MAPNSAPRLMLALTCLALAAGTTSCKARKSFSRSNDIPEPRLAPTLVKDLRFPRRTGHFPSPASWADEMMYFILIDRFENGDPSNDCGHVTVLREKKRPKCDKANPHHFHGGDLAGITSRLDYLKELGVTTLWVSPFQTTNGEYHGYSISDFLNVDPNFGTRADLARLVDKAHERGIRVIMDLVVNHTAPNFTYVGNDYAFGCRLADESTRKRIDSWTENIINPSDLRDQSNYTRCGDIANWQDRYEAENGDFFGLKDLASYKPELPGLMAAIAKYWIATADIDGIRVDAVRHVDDRFWGPFLSQVDTFAKSVGKDNFLAFGEVYDGNYATIASYLGPHRSSPSVAAPSTGFNSMLDFGTFLSSVGAFKVKSGVPGESDIARLAHADEKASTHFGEHSITMLRFLDSHDSERILLSGENPKLRDLGLVWLMTTRGIPLFMYGTEQDLKQVEASVDAKGTSRPYENYDGSMTTVVAHEQGTRADMFAGGEFKHGSDFSAPSFSRKGSTFALVRDLISLRKRSQALRRGNLLPRWHQPHGKGIYAFSRVSGAEEVLIVLNNSGEERVAEIPLPAPKGRVSWKNALTGDDAVLQEAGEAKITVKAPPFGALILTDR